MSAETGSSFMIDVRTLSKIGLAIGCLAIAVEAQEPTRHVKVQVRETLGIRRFGYPVTAVIPLPPGGIQTTKQVRLANADGKPIPAQITASAKHEDGSLKQIEVDFNLSPGPLEESNLRLEYGIGVSAVEPKQGLTFSESEDAFQVSAYTVRKDARPLIASVRYGREYLRPGGLGVVAWRDGTELPLHTAKRNWTVEKQGPFQVRLRCDGVYAAQGAAAELPFTLSVEFVSSKSWVGLRHAIKPAAKPGEQIELGIVGDFKLDGRLLWDTDCSYWLYGVLEAGEQMHFATGMEGWSCRLGKVGQELLYARHAPENKRARGWGHFQEARENGNVIAFGFGGSATTGEYSFKLGGDGKLLMRGTVAAASAPVELDAFFHFIPVPTQHTARTSPSAMMSPLEVTYPGQ